MRDKLVILLNANDLQASTWVTLTQTGLVSEAAICTADVLSSAQVGREIIVLVPTEEVLLLKVAMPVMPRAKLLQALPFALEDQIIADLDTQHAVPADEIIDGKVTAAVVAHAKMQLWLDQLKPGKRLCSRFPVLLIITWLNLRMNWRMTKAQICCKVDTRLKRIGLKKQKNPLH